MIISMIISLLLTIIIEISISFIIGIRENEDLKVVLWTNVLTNPVVVYIANCVKVLNNDVIYSIVIFILEVSVIIIEFCVFKKFFNYKKKTPLLISSMNNIISFLLGIILSKIIF
ncbi:MAG: hypothetical protein IKF38_01795 [Clostridia bacterium]|nr:hypothetical protein [Clostridia bacterium]